MANPSISNFLGERPKMYDRIKDYYDNKYYENAAIGFKDTKRLKDYFTCIPLCDTGRDKVLDFGCGTGQACYELTQKGYDVYGIDISQKALGVASNIVPDGKFVLSQESGLFPFPDANFKYIVCLGVLEHIEQPKTTLNEMHRTLKDDGQAVMIVPNRSSPYFWLGHGTGQVYEKARTMREWEDLFRSCGFAVENVKRDIGFSWSKHLSFFRKAKYLMHKLMNLGPVGLTYQFVFILKKGQ